MSVKVHEVCDHIVGTGLHADMLANLSWQTLSADSLNDPKSGTKRDFVEAHLAILHHVLRKTVTGRSALRQCQSLDVVNKFRACSEFPVHPATYLLLTLIFGILTPFSWASGRAPGGL